MPGIFRRRHDYRIAKRLVLGVAAVAAVGPTLFVRPRAQVTEQPSFQYYQRRKVLPPTLAGGGPPAGPPPNLRPKPLPTPKVFRRPWDYIVRQRVIPFTLAGGGPPAGPPPNIRPKLLPAPEVFRRPWDYIVRHRFPAGPLVASDQTITLTSGIASAEAFGTAVITTSIIISPVAVVSAEAFGSLNIEGGLPLGDSDSNKVQIYLYEDTLPFYGTPGQFAILHRDGQNPVLCMWDHVDNRWKMVNLHA